MRQHFFSAAFFIYVFSVTAFAQSSLECSRFGDDSYERVQCEERAKENTRSVYRTRFLNADTSLLPDAPGAWVLHIITFGGFSGKGLPTLTIRSTGEFACGEAEPLQFTSFETAKLKTLSDIITPPNFEITDSLSKTDNSIPVLCSDCYQTKILLARREANGNVRVYGNSSKLMKYPQIAEKFSLIRQNASDLVACEK